MFDHLGIHVRDLEASEAFYTAALEPLGISLVGEHAMGESRWLVYGTGPGEPFLVVACHPDRSPDPIHVALVASSEEAVARFHAGGLGAGGTDHGAPGPRAASGPYYAAYLLDPDGNNVEAGFRGGA